MVQGDTYNLNGGGQFMWFLPAQGISTIVNTPRGTVVSGSTAEWIVERPTINGVLPVLADYGCVTAAWCVDIVWPNFAERRRPIW